MKTRHFDFLLWRVIAGVWWFGLGWQALANPTGMTVQSGSASAAVNGSQLTVTTSQIAFLNWQRFNIAAGETTIFNQPSAYSVAVNRITDQNPSQIYGSLQANGIVVLMNASGFYFGPNSFIKTGGLIVSTANCIPPQNSGGSWEFNGPPPLASIVNYGQIQVGNGGSAFLIADNVENHGDIEAPGGSVGLASGQTVLLSERPDGRGMSMEVTLPKGSVNNYGTIVADGGTIAMNAKVVNQNGFIQANSVQNQNGVIELVASDQLNLGANSQISAHGDDFSVGSSGGSVTLQSGNNFSDNAGSQIDVSGGSQGGNGGNVEISAPNILSLNSSMEAGAQSGWLGGELLLDPVDIVLGTSSANGAINVNTAFSGFSQILLQASGNITLNANTAWNLSTSSGQTSGQLTLEAGNNIALQDGSSISDGNNWSVTLVAGYVNNAISYGQGSILLNGGTGSIQTAAGNINLEAGQNILVGSGYVITTGGGSISAHALAGNIDTGSDAQGYYFDTYGTATSLSQAYNLSDGLGGISTAAGGDVTLIAGGNVTSVLPVNVNGKIGYVYDGNSLTSVASGHTDFSTAGSGAYGNQAGNVTIVAGGNVTGHYLAANGVGSIFAGVQMDANGNPKTDSSGNYVLGTTGSAGTDANKFALALSLISGGWNVTAAQNLYLQEVRNPNGVFDTSAGTAYKHYFDYAPGDYVNLDAGNLVQLGASPSTLPRAAGLAIPFIYPSILNITAGASGVQLTGSSTAPFNQLILFPSPQGSLTINTTDGGSLVGSLPSSGAPQAFKLIVSDSGKNQYKSSGDFGDGTTPVHAATPIHLNSPTPIVLNISGDMDLVNLIVPESAQINVGGNMVNCGFQGMNLAANDVTSIHVTGDVYDRSSFTDLAGVTAAEAANLFYLSWAVNNSSLLASSFYYNPATQTLTYQDLTGKTLLGITGTTTLAKVLSLLNNLTVQKYVNGVPQWKDPPYDTEPDTETVSVLGDPTVQGTVAYALLAQYNQLGAIPNNASTSGFIIGGGGKFDISARSIDLGTSAGILSEGVGLYTVGSSYPLASLFGNGGVFDHGADINVTTTGNHFGGTTAAGEPFGDLDMYSSSIATLNGGNVSINAGGDVNAGSSVLAVSSASVRGIYSTSGGDVSVIANGDVNVNGSRIVTYDGGNVTVESLNGSVNAGTGASLPVTLNAFYENPITHAVYYNGPQLPFSGIAALTFRARNASYPAPTATLGNILVEAPNGDVTANAAGILQIALNHLNYPDATTLILAGYELRDSSDHAAPAAATGEPTVQELSESAPGASDPARTVVINGDQLQVSATVWPTLLALLGLPSNDSQVIHINVTADKAGFETALLGDGTGLANYNFLGLVSSGKNINASNSGIITSNAKLDASGNIIGLIFARNDININAQQNINVSALGQGNVSVNSAGGTVSGTIIGVGGVSASGSSIDASLISANVTGTTSGQSGLGQGTAANATAQAMSSDDANKVLASSDQSDDDDKKKKKEVALAQKVGRVTVILPAKSSSPTSSRKQTSTQPL
ncbi:MAG: filamentous hemagglutinin N-terminal domain-containing protein [Verrucomicrobiota bacterium]|jgi:filamentous hemagglutinin family protein